MLKEPDLQELERFYRQNRKDRFIEEKAQEKKSFVQHRTIMINFIMVGLVYFFFLTGGGGDLLNIIFIMAAVLLIKMVNVVLTDWERLEINFIKRDADFQDLKFCYKELRKRQTKN